MHVWLVSTIGYPSRVKLGGVPTATRNIAHALAQAGHRVSVIAKWVNGAPSREQDGPITIHWMPMGNLHYYLSRLPADLGVWPRTLRALEWGLSIRRALLQNSRQESVDAVLYSNVWADGLLHPGHIASAVRMDTPLCTVRSVPGCGNRAGWGSFERLERGVVRSADLICCPSASTAKIVGEQYGILRGKVVVIPNPVDIQQFSPIPRPDRGVLRVLHISRLNDWQKGTHILLQAMEYVVKRIPNVELRLVGSGQPSLAGISDEVRGVTQLQRWQDAFALASEYSLADVTVVSSLNWETFGNVCVESYACGTPVIASDVGGLGDVVQDGRTGLLVPPGDPQALGRAIVDLLSDPGVRLVMGLRARREAEERYSFRVVGHRMAELFEGICRRP